MCQAVSAEVHKLGSYTNVSMTHVPISVVKNVGPQGKFMTRRRLISHYARSKDPAAAGLNSRRETVEQKILSLSKSCVEMGF